MLRQLPKSFESFWHKHSKWAYPQMIENMMHHMSSAKTGLKRITATYTARKQEQVSTLLTFRHIQILPSFFFNRKTLQRFKYIILIAFVNLDVIKKSPFFSFAPLGFICVNPEFDYILCKYFAHTNLSIF